MRGTSYHSAGSSASFLPSLSEDLLNQPVHKGQLVQLSLLGTDSYLKWLERSITRQLVIAQSYISPSTGILPPLCITFLSVVLQHTSYQWKRFFSFN